MPCGKRFLVVKKRRQSSRILIVDDEEVVLDYLTTALRSFNDLDDLEITGTSDGRHALELCRRSEPDLMVLDLHLPGLDGFEVLTRLRRQSDHEAYLPVVAITADRSAETRLRALRAGATEFLSKPFDLLEAQLRIHNLLEMRRLHLRVAGQKHELERTVRERTGDLERLWLTTVERLALIAEFRDDITHKHTIRVAQSSAAVARELGLPDQEVELIARAAPLHDIGKVGIPDRLLLKPGALTEEEFEEMKEHTEIGARILTGTSSPMLELGRQIALYHHERWDGQGYRGVHGASIPLGARIVAVTDVYDALTNARPYKEVWPVDRALAEIKRERGKHFDPEVVDAFLRVIATHGAGSVATGGIVDRVQVA